MKANFSEIRILLIKSLEWNWYSDKRSILFLDLSLSWLAWQFPIFCLSCWKDLFNCTFRALAPCGHIIKLDPCVVSLQCLQTFPLPSSGAESCGVHRTALSPAGAVNLGFFLGNGVGLTSYVTLKNTFLCLLFVLPGLFPLCSMPWEAYSCT